MKLQKLIDFIKEHGDEVLSHTETTITLRAVYIHPQRGCYTVDETIDANPQAVRDWLGY